MIVGGLLREYEVLAPRTHVSRSGEAQVTWLNPQVVTVVRGWVQPRAGGESEPIRAMSELIGRAYLTVNAAVTNESRLRERSGRVWRLTAPPAVKGSPFGVDHIEVDVVAVEVADGAL